MTQQRGRKSQAHLAIVAPIPTGRPQPPPDLTEEQAEVWRSTAAALPHDWFPRETLPILAQYCRHVCRARWLAKWLDKNAPGMTVAELDKGLAMSERESRAVLAHARSLRLTLQSRTDPKTAGRHSGGAVGYYSSHEVDDDY
jgi:hypothetical protein